MPLFNWSDQFVLGIEEIDQQHKQLVNLINELYEARQTNKPANSLNKIVDGLMSYTRIHLSHEEILLKQNNYPYFASHKSEHDELTQKAINIQKEYNKGNESISTDLAILLNDWLAEHILMVDRKYVDFLKGKEKNYISAIENTKDVLVGIREIDDQHARVLDIFGAIQKAKDENNEDEIMKKARQLIELWKEHFKYEEDLMEQYEYSDFDEHKEEHESITMNILNLEKMYVKGFKYVVPSLTLHLHEWIEDHIKHVSGKDKELGQFLNSKGVT